MHTPSLYISRTGAMRHALAAVKRGRCKTVTIKPRVRFAHERNSDFGYNVTMFGNAGQFVGML